MWLCIIYVHKYYKLIMLKPFTPLQESNELKKFSLAELQPDNRFIVDVNKTEGNINRKIHTYILTASHLSVVTIYKLYTER